MNSVEFIRAQELYNRVTVTSFSFFDPSLGFAVHCCLIKPERLIDSFLLLLGIAASATVTMKINPATDFFGESKSHPQSSYCFLSEKKNHGEMTDRQLFAAKNRTLNNVTTGYHYYVTAYVRKH